MDLVDALAAEGIVCAVGAGGKKTTLYALADRLDRAAVTATVRIPIFDDEVADVAVTDDPLAAIRGAEAWPLGVVPAREREDRYLGYDTGTVAGLADADCDAVLVKADGARMRRFKAPGEGEPQVPANADTVLPVASARVVGETLGEGRVHRPERVAAITGLDPGDPIRERDVAAVLASPDGGLKAVPDDATVVPVVNMVDDAGLRETGRAIADAVLDRTDRIERVALTRMDRGELVAAVT